MVLSFFPFFLFFFCKRFAAAGIEWRGKNKVNIVVARVYRDAVSVVVVATNTFFFSTNQQVPTTTVTETGRLTLSILTFLKLDDDDDDDLATTAATGVPAHKKEMAIEGTLAAP